MITEKSSTKDSKKRTSNGQGDTLWLSNSLVVWENVIKREVAQQRQKLQMREEGAQLLAQTSQVTQRAVSELHELKKRIEGEGNERRRLLNEISELHYLLQEKKINEEQMIHYVQDVATQLDENLPAVLQYIRREGFDDYVSSTDEDDEGEVQGFAPLPEEPTDDVLAIMSSLDSDPDDPNYNERIRQMSHRPVGPLLEFTAKKAKYLKEVSQQGAQQQGAKSSRPSKPLSETLDRAVMLVQQRLTDEVVSFVRNRQNQIQQGLLDPRNERLNADPKYIEHARIFHQRVETFVQMQKDSPSGRPLTYRNDSLTVRNASSAPRNNNSSNSGAAVAAGSRIVIEGARLPPEVNRGNSIVKANYFITNALRGSHSLVVSRRTLTPELRHIFLSRDLTKLIARRPKAQSAADADALVLRLLDVTDIVLGHKTDVFREARIASKHVIREELAFSVLTSVGSTLDVECNSLEDRNYWASIFAWIVNETRPGGVMHVLTRSNKVSVVDTLNQTPVGVEVEDRQNLQLRIAA